jgi:diguanylate cyclase (GGDEF)-like protein/PAS domain S-box-containing protein
VAAAPIEIDALPAPLLVFESDALVDANAAATTELGAAAADLLGGGFAATLRPASADELAVVLAAGSASRLTVRRQGPTAGDEYFELRVAARVHDRTVVLITDVTELHRLDAAVAALGNATVALDASAQMVWRPFGNQARFGVSDDEALGAQALGWIHPDELPHMLETFTRLLAQPGERSTELIRMRHPYVEDGWLMSRVTGVNRLDDPAMGAIVVRTEDAAPVDLVEDITHTTGPFRSLGEAAPVGIIVIDRVGTVLYRNELASRLLGLDGDELGPGWVARVRSSSTAELDALLAAALRGQRGTRLLAVEHRSVPEPVWLRIDVMPQLDEHERTFGLIATLLDVTSETEARRQLAEAQERLWHLATHDPLTGLPNRVLFLERLEDELARRDGLRRPVALLYCDLDGFKPVNDRLGHGVGDAVLRVVAERMAANVRDSDLVCRFGGDEFLVLCSGFDETREVEALAARLARAVGEPMKVGSEVVQVGITVGIAHADEHDLVDDLITAADDAMYASKGRAAR